MPPYRDIDTATVDGGSDLERMKEEEVKDKKDSSPPTKERRAPRRRLTQNNSGMRGSFTTSLQNVLEDEPTTQTNDNDNSNSQDLGKSHEQFVEQQSNNDNSSQSTEDTTNNNNNYRPRARRPNRHLHGKSGRMNKSLVQSLKFDSIFSSQTTRNSSSLPSDLQNYNESINIMDFGVSEDLVNASFNLSDPSNAASGVTSPSSNASNNMSYLVDSDNFMGWNGSKGNESSLSNLVDSQGFLNWNAADSQEDIAEGAAKSKDEEDTTEEQNDTITPIEDNEHGGKLSKSSSTSSTENVLTKQMKRLSSTLSTATKRSSWDTNGSRRASEELSDVEDNESFAMPRFNKEDEHVDIGELRKDLIAAAKKESDEGGGKKNPFLKRVSCLLEQN